MSKNDNSGLVLDGWLNFGRARSFAVMLLILILVVATALGVIFSSHQSRQLFGDLLQHNREKSRLEEEWGRLLLEQSTWASHSRIERLAKSELHMIVPNPESIIVVRQ
tara:strand:+ start:187 stop:510 length:324 start_codon:yes stop_codon:yes gene_type:complete